MVVREIDSAKTFFYRVFQRLFPQVLFGGHAVKAKGEMTRIIICQRAYYEGAYREERLSATRAAQKQCMPSDGVGHAEHGFHLRVVQAFER